MAQSSMVRVMALPEIRHMIFNRIESLQDLAQCALVSRLWHTYSIEYLWKGEAPRYDAQGPDWELSELAAVAASGPHRFKHYARHIEHLCLVISAIAPFDRAVDNFSDLDRAAEILQLDFWNSTLLKSLDLTVTGPAQVPPTDYRWPPELELPIFLLQPRLRVLRLSGFALNDSFLAACQTSLSLRGLYLKFSYGHTDIDRLCSIVRAQKDSLRALEVCSANIPRGGFAPLVAQILQDQHPLTHLALAYQCLENQPTPSSTIASATRSNLQSLTLSNGPMLSFLLSLPEPLKLRRIVVKQVYTSYRDTLMVKHVDLRTLLVGLSRIPTLEEVIVGCREGDESGDVSKELQNFATACPSLRKMRFVRSSIQFLSVSADILCHIAKSCPHLTSLEWQFVDETTYASGDTLLAEVLKSLPLLVDLDIGLYCTLQGIPRISAAFGTKLPLKKLKLRNISVDDDQGLGPKAENDVFLDLYNELMTGLPHLRTVKAFSTGNNVVERALLFWNERLSKLEEPIPKTPGSQILEKLDEEMLYR